MACRFHGGSLNEQAAGPQITMTDYIIPNNDNMNSEVWGSSLDAEGFFSTDPLMDLGSDLLDDDLFQASEIHEPAGSKARDDGQPSLGESPTRRLSWNFPTGVAED
jgi:hypothetical protein